MSPDELTRRRLLALGVAVPLVAAACGEDDDAAAPAARLAPTPACDDGDADTTAEQTEGPYYTPDTPRRRRLRTPGMQGRVLVLTGRVLRPDCRPAPRALLDFWQADADGVYDNEGYTLRGHQFTDARGRYRLVTVVPGLYPGRTRHVHVKVQARGGDVLTTQLYFPGERRNSGDAIYDSALRMRLRRGERWAGRFDFVV
jgi:protocatechuate 3,4-dioxygenase beta subunit